MLLYIKIYYICTDSVGPYGLVGNNILDSMKATANCCYDYYS